MLKPCLSKPKRNVQRKAAYSVLTQACTEFFYRTLKPQVKMKQCSFFNSSCMDQPGVGQQSYKLRSISNWFKFTQSVLYVHTINLTKIHWNIESILVYQIMLTTPCNYPQNSPSSKKPSFDKGKHLFLSNFFRIKTNVVILTSRSEIQDTEELLKSNCTELVKLVVLNHFLYSLGEKTPTLPRKLTCWGESFLFLKEGSLILGACT